MNKTLFILFTLLGLELNAQEYQYPETTVGFLVIYSTNDFDKAHLLGQKSADSLNTDFSDGYLFDQEEGLIDTTTCGCGIQHGYIPRGRFDDGDYISVELTDSYDLSGEFGRYLVVACSYPVSFHLWPDIIENIRKKYPEAYYFETTVYTGCMH